jgi:hypothetical protein
MNGLQEVRIAKTAAPTPIGGGDSNGLAYRAPPARTGEPRGSPLEPPKRWHERQSRRVFAKKSAAFVAEVLWDANPEHVFDVRREVYRHALKPDFRNATCPSCNARCTSLGNPCPAGPFFAIVIKMTENFLI